jgi:uncharacterized membrane protein
MKQHINQLHKDSFTITERIATKITNMIGTFTCFIIFSILALISLPAVIQSHNAIVWVSWITQTFLQLVLLPLIMVSQNLQSRHSEYLAEATYENDLAMHKDIDKIIKILTKNML